MNNRVSPPCNALSKAHPRPSSRRGFSLVELLVTLLISIVVVAAIYVMYSESTRAFQTERQVMEIHAQLRFAMDHIRADIRRTAFQSTGNNKVDTARVCWTPPNTNLYAVSIERNNGFVHEPSLNQNIKPSAITLFGDFFSPSGYTFPAIQIDSFGNIWMDPNDPVLSPMNEEEFTSIFRPGSRWMRVVNRDEKEWYAPIESVDYPNRRVTLASVPPVTGYCLASFGASEVNPVGWIRYRLAEDTRTAKILGGDAADRVNGKTDLIREEIDEDGLPVAGTALVVAEFAVDLQFYDFGFDLTNTGAINSITTFPLVEDIVNLDGSGMLGNSDLSATPERLRFLTVKLSVRAAFEEEGFLLKTRTGIYSPLSGFDVDPDKIGAARVVSTAIRVDLRNLVLRRLGG